MTKIIGGLESPPTTLNPELSIDNVFRSFAKHFNDNFNRVTYSAENYPFYLGDILPPDKNTEADTSIAQLFAVMSGGTGGKEGNFDLGIEIRIKRDEDRFYVRSNKLADEVLRIFEAPVAMLNFYNNPATQIPAPAVMHPIFDNFTIDSGNEDQRRIVLVMFNVKVPRWSTTYDRQT